MEVWGITGLLGTGKTTVCEYLRSKGCGHIDVDKLTSILVDRNTEAGKDGFEKIFRTFGATVLDSQGKLDRSALRRRIMQNPSDKERLEEILDPLVKKHLDASIEKWRKEGVKIAFVEGARLIDAGLHKHLMGIIMVSADFDKRVTRLCKRDSMAKEELTELLHMQDHDNITANAKFELNNDGTLAKLHKKLDDFVASRLKK